MVPLSIMSTFVSTPNVRLPSGSNLCAIYSASEFAISVLIGMTLRIIDISSSIYFYARSLVIFSISWVYEEPASGTFVIPGRSMRVRFGQVAETIVSVIGSSTIPLLVPAFSAVIDSMRFFTSSLKFVYILVSLKKYAYGRVSEFYLLIQCCRRIINGTRVTTPVPRGRKSKPTIYSSNEDFPEDYEPKTTIFGSFTSCSMPQSRNMSIT